MGYQNTVHIFISSKTNVVCSLTASHRDAANEHTAFAFINKYCIFVDFFYLYRYSYCNFSSLKLMHVIHLSSAKFFSGSDNAFLSIT